MPHRLPPGFVFLEVALLRWENWVEKDQLLLGKDSNVVTITESSGKKETSRLCLACVSTCLCVP